jgi:hypothetical protein
MVANQMQPRRRYQRRQFLQQLLGAQQQRRGTVGPRRFQRELQHRRIGDTESNIYSNGLVTVAFKLEDTFCNGGGFGCLAGSHKGHLPVPAAWRDLSQGVHPMVTRVPAPAGAAIIFTEALQHVTLPWTVPNTRTTLFYKYTPQGEAYSGQASFFCPSDADGWDGADDRKRAILTPPASEYIERKAALADAAAD